MEGSEFLGKVFLTCLIIVIAMSIFGGVCIFFNWLEITHDYWIGVRVFGAIGAIAGVLAIIAGVWES